MKIGIARNDGGLSVMSLADDASDEFIAKEIGRWEANTGFSAMRWEPITEDPPREFRDAYELADGAPRINMDKARNLKRDELRRERAPLLAALDVDYQRADEAGDAKAKASVATRKQALRDITKDPRIDAAKTPDELLKVSL